MDFFFNVRFDPREEYSAFCAHADAFFQKKEKRAESVKAKKVNAKREAKRELPKAKPAEADKRSIKEFVPSKDLVAHRVEGYQPSKALVEKVNEMILKGQSFRAVDVAKGAVKNSNYKAKVNKWLQSHPSLSFSRQKTSGKGKGVMVYTPLENGKALLPPGTKPNRTDWPIKGATYRPSHNPRIDRDEDERLDEELFADFETSDTQVAS